eukprot:TRINITY_DN2119_c0_g1_i2.p1 TRINITY_DN2119_c0_g1~~TRINITY_DN2119_c0_g1_i2.p1  ORF type:complete len:334 (+),score=39.84 TRINITY_DN2119_c0_g1_i2:455-1456(+)
MPLKHSPSEADVQPNVLSFKATLKDSAFRESRMRFVAKKGKLFVKVTYEGTVQFWKNFTSYPHTLARFKSGVTTRRELNLIFETRADIMKILPILFWIKILPFSSLYVPLFLMKYPTLLPSTFNIALMAGVESKVSLFAKIARERQKLYLQSVEEDKKNFAALLWLKEHLAKNYTISFNDIITHQELFFCSELEMYSLSNQQIYALMIGINCYAFTMPVWPTYAILRRLSFHFERLRSDDYMIVREGVHSLSKEELREACLNRGLKVLKLDDDALRVQLLEWAKLSLDHPRLLRNFLLCVHAYEFMEVKMAPLWGDLKPHDWSIWSLVSQLPK